MRKLIAAVGLQSYALMLAFAQLHNGVRTDEAKYLLNIPYPHPPLARWLLGHFDGWQWQEHFARILFASLMVHAVWLVWDMGRSLRPAGRVSLCVLWLASAAFVVQTGTVMMAPLTALQALLFLWMLSLPTHRIPSVATIAFLWLVALFTALQGVLLLPLVVALLRLKGVRVSVAVWCILAPIAVVGLYSLGNPLLMASLTLQANKDGGSTVMERAQGLAWILTIAGSGIGSIIGILGLLSQRRWASLASFCLFALYVFIGRFDYYAILFLPFFVAGAAYVYRRVPLAAVLLSILQLACTALILTHHVPLLTQRSPARHTLNQLPAPVNILLKGSFGHEWQYEAAPGQRLGPYSAQAASMADVVICFDDCDELEGPWAQLYESLPNTWWPLAAVDE